MIRCYVCCPERNEMVLVAGAARKLLQQHGISEKPVCVFKPLELQQKMNGVEQQIKVVTCDIRPVQAVQVLESLRAEYPDMKLILLADESVPPTAYIRPTVLPTALLWRPVTETDSQQVLKDVFSTLQLQQPGEKELEEGFQIEVRGTIRRYAYREILYFEARDKRLWLHLQHKELPFPGTLEKLLDQLPEGFLRVHKSFIANRAHVVEIQYGQSMMFLSNGEALPISRSYKAEVKAVFA